MPNPSPLAARLAKRRRHRPGDLQALLRAVWGAVRDGEIALAEAATGPERTSAIHAMAAIAGAYAKLLQVGEYEARLARLEQLMEIPAHGAPLPSDAAGPRGVRDSATEDQ